MTDPDLASAESSRELAPSPRAASGKTRLVLLWALVRIPALLLAAYLARNHVISWIEALFDVGGATLFVIRLMSTPLARVLLFVGFVLSMGACMWVVRKRDARIAYGVTLATGFVLIVLAFQLSGTSKLLILPVLAVLTANLLPDAIAARVSGRARQLGMLLGVGVAEALFFGRYVRWLVELGGSPRLASMKRDSTVRMLGLGMAATVLSAAVQGQGLISLEQGLRMSSSARILVRGDFNWIELDASRQRLFATGHGIARLQRYDVTDFSKPPLETDVVTAGAQGFAIDHAGSLIYLFNTETGALLQFDANTLKLTQTTPLPELSPGDPWITVDRSTNTVAIASEADQKQGKPFLLLDRTNLQLLQSTADDPSYLLLHPNKPILFQDYSRRTQGVATYDLRERRITKFFEMKGRPDRMAFWPATNELFVPVPVESTVLSLDGDTLALKRVIRTVFGVRVVALDEQRRIMFAGSLATGQLAIIDLTTGRELSRHYLGPWLRTIQPVPEKQLAYVSSNGMLFELRY